MIPPRLDRQSTEALLALWIEHDDEALDERGRVRVSQLLRSRGCEPPEQLPAASEVDEEPLLDEQASAALAALPRSSYGWYVGNRLVVFCRLLSRIAAALVPATLLVAVVSSSYGRSEFDAARAALNTIVLAAAGLGSRALSRRVMARQVESIESGDFVALVLHPRDRNHRYTLGEYAARLWEGVAETPGYAETLAVALAALELSPDRAPQPLARSIELLDRIEGLRLGGWTAPALAAIAADRLGRTGEACERAGRLVREHPGVAHARRIYAHTRARLLARSA